MTRVFQRLVICWKNLTSIKKQANEVIKQYGQRQNPGIWRLRVAEKPMLIRHTRKSAAFFRKNLQVACSHAEKGYRVNNVMKNALLSLTWGIRIVRAAPTEGPATDCIMFSSNGGVFLFDFEGETIEKNYKQDDMNHGYLRLLQAGYWKVFHSPVLWIEGKRAVEQMLPSTIETKQEREKYLRVLKGYAQYFQMASPVSTVSLGHMLETCKQRIPDRDMFFPQDLLSVAINCYVLHGDVYELNVFDTHRDGLTIIDYGSVCENVFFYDLLFWPCMEICNHASWGLWMELEDDHSEIGQVLNEILVCQGIKPLPEIKRAFLILVPAIRRMLQEQAPGTMLLNDADNKAQTAIHMIVNGLRHKEVRERATAGRIG